jgi:hypothetical protein
LIAAGFDRKWFSDAQLLSYSWWIIFVVAFMSEMHGVPWIIAVFTIVAFPLLNIRVFRSLSKVGSCPPRNLLFLRVFSGGPRAARLYDRIVGRWRLIGPVTVITAPDLIARFVDASDFLRLVTGRVCDSFVESESDLKKRLLGLDIIADPDGRYRVNKFWCRAHTWQATAAHTMSCCDVVIVDVRGLGPDHLGVQFELRELAERVHVERIVLVVNALTDRSLISRLMAAGNGELKLVSVPKGSSREVANLFDALIESAQTPVALAGPV